MRVTIRNWETVGRVGQPLRVGVEFSQGRPVSVLTAFSDGQTRAALEATHGFYPNKGQTDVWVLPQQAGTWRLTVSAIDARGCRDETAVVRTVTVQ